MTALNIIFGFLLGAVTGSFLTAALWRLPRGYEITGRSVCPSCGKQLSNKDNIPIVGYLKLGGRSGCCDNPIPIRYLLYELAAALVGAGIGYFAGLLYCFLALGAVVVASIIWSLFTERRPVSDEGA